MKVIVRKIEISRIREGEKFVDARHYRDVFLDIGTANGSEAVLRLELPVADCNYLKVGETFNLCLLREES